MDGTILVSIETAPIKRELKQPISDICRAFTLSCDEDMPCQVLGRYKQSSERMCLLCLAVLLVLEPAPIDKRIIPEYECDGRAHCIFWLSEFSEYGSSIRPHPLLIYAAAF
jgi:hypothetical protein